MTTKEFLGEDLEQAYAKVFGGKVIGGFKDCGHDVTTGDRQVPTVQVKSSVSWAVTFLANAVKYRRRFTPVCIGEPGSRDEMIDSLKKFGAWIARDTPNREKSLAAVAQARQLCRT